MDQDNEGNGEGRRFARLRSALKPKTRGRRIAQPADPGIAKPTTPPFSPPALTVTLSSTQTPTKDGGVVNTVNSDLVPDGPDSPGPTQTAVRVDLSNDRERTEKRYSEAVSGEAQKCSQTSAKELGSFRYSRFQESCGCN